MNKIIIHNIAGLKTLAIQKQQRLKDFWYGIYSIKYDNKRMSLAGVDEPRRCTDYSIGLFVIRLSWKTK